MSDWEDAPSPLSTPTVSSEWETAPIPEPTSRADLIPDTPKQPTYKEPTLGEKAVGLGEAALTLGTGALAFPAGLASGLSQLTLGRFTERGGSNQAAEETMKDVMGRYTYAPRTEAGKESVQGMETIIRESGASGLMPGLAPHVPAIGAGATKFLQDRLPSRTKGELPVKEGSIPTVEQPITSEITPEVPTKSTVDTTLEQWQTELSAETPNIKPIEPQGEAVTPLEATAEDKGIPTLGNLEGASQKLESLKNPPKEYHPKEAIDASIEASAELKRTDSLLKEAMDKEDWDTVSAIEDHRTTLRMVKTQATEMLQGDGFVMNRNGSYIDFIEVPEELRKGGLGTSLVKSMEADIKAEGHKSVFLLSKEDAVPFWEKQGYKVSESHVFEKGENVPMSKSLKEEPTKSPLAKTTKENEIILNDKAIETDFNAGFPYMFSPDSPTGLQKAEVFKQLGVDKEQFSQLVTTPEEYSAFIKAHEESHVKNNDKATYPRTEEGKTDLMHPDAIAIEVRATQDALNDIKKTELPLKEGKIPSIYDVVDEADFHAKGKEVLKAQGPEAARKFADNYIRARGTDPILVKQNVEQFISKEVQQHGNTIEVASDIIERGANAILADTRKADIYSQSIVDRIPDAKKRDKITRALEKERESDLLNPRTDKEAISVMKEVETRLNKIGTEAKQAGLLEGLRDNYVTHIMDFSKSKLSKQEQTDFMQKIQEKLAAAPKDSKLIKDFTQKRQFTFLRDLEEMLATMRAQDFNGMEHGVVVHTDIAKIVNAYEKAMQTAKIQKSMIDYLKINKDVNGRPWLMKDGDAAKEAKYVSFEGKGARPLKDYRVHPDLADAMNFMFREKDPGMLVRGLGAVSHLTKALNTVGSLFHAKSLIEAGGLTSPGLMLKEIFTLGSGTKAALKSLKSGDDPLIDLLIREGGLMVKVEDIQRTIVPEMGQFLDNTATKFSKLLKGPNVKLVQHITDPLDKVVLQRLNAFTWDFMHAGQKVNVAKHLFTKMKLKNPEIPDAQLAKEVGDYVNSTFGGLNWLQVANSVQNKYLKALAMKTMNTSGREWAQIVMFAPDWTVSTLRAFTNALPKELSKPKNWHLLEGAKGVYNPKTKGDLARRYVVTTALSWLTLLNGINMMLSDKPIWENKDPTRVEFKDGTSMQAAKHSMEAAHWMMAPDKTLGNKLGFWPKAVFVGTTATAYPSPTAPKLKDPSAIGRAKAIALLGMPFQVSSAVQSPEGEALKRAGLSTMGFPVYGVSGEKLKEAQRKGRLESKERKLRQQTEESQ